MDTNHFDKASNRELQAKIAMMKKEIHEFKNSDDPASPSYDSMNSQDPGQLNFQSDAQGAQQYYYKQNNYVSQGSANRFVAHPGMAGPRGRVDKSPTQNRHYGSHLSFKAPSYMEGNPSRAGAISKERSGSRDKYESNASSLIPNEEAMEKNLINKVNNIHYYGATGLNDRSQRIKEKYSSRGSDHRAGSSLQARSNSGSQRVSINPVTGGQSVVPSGPNSPTMRKKYGVRGSLVKRNSGKEKS